MSFYCQECRMQVESMSDHRANQHQEIDFGSLDYRIDVLGRAIQLMWNYRGLSAWWRRRQLVKEWNELVAQRLKQNAVT